MHKITTAIAAVALVGATALTSHIGSANLTTPAHHKTATVTRHEPAIPHCKNDDYNDGSQAVCYTQRVTDGAYIVIDRHDRVVSVHVN